MLDTIRIEHFGQWRSEITPGWKDSRYSTSFTSTLGDVPKQGRLLSDPETGLRVGGREESSRWLEVSLPRLLFETNGYVIRNQGQLEQAISRLNEIAATVTEFQRTSFKTRVTRLDLVGQFLVEPADMMAAHRETSHPLIRGRKSHYEGESLHFVGKERHCRIYDKVKEMSKVPGHVTRVEWQLRGKALSSAFGLEHVSMEDLTIEGCYQAYRNLCVRFTPTALPCDSNLYDLLSVAGKEGTTVMGLSVFDYWSRGKNRKTVSRVRREVAKRRSETFKIDWTELIPEDFGRFRMVDYYEPNPF